MARYDDENRPRRYNERDDDDDFPPRQPSRRDTLMQRRLRAARGEEVDERPYDEEDDYTSRPRYSRPRNAYAPSYNSGGNGCAMTVLYVVLGAAAIAILFFLVGRQMLGNLVPNVPQQVRQLVATPTTTLRDRGGTITQIRNLNRLETQSFSVDRVVEAKVERGNPLDILLGDRLLLIASGDVIAGVDLSKLKDSDVTISQDGKSVTLRLPPSEIFSKSLNNDRTRVYDRQAGLFAPENQDLETQARSEAEAQILQAACEGNIMQKAADEAQRSVERFVKLLDFEQVNIIATAGSCVAPGSATATPTS